MVVCADHRAWSMEGTPLGGDIRGRGETGNLKKIEFWGLSQSLELHLTS